jgi:hypothetical protein
MLQLAAMIVVVSGSWISVLMLLLHELAVVTNAIVIYWINVLLLLLLPLLEIAAATMEVSDS